MTRPFRDSIAASGRGCWRHKKPPSRRRDGGAISTLRGATLIGAHDSRAPTQTYGTSVYMSAEGRYAAPGNGGDTGAIYSPSDLLGVGGTAPESIPRPLDAGL